MISSGVAFLNMSATNLHSWVSMSCLVSSASGDASVRGSFSRLNSRSSGTIFGARPVNARMRVLGRRAETSLAAEQAIWGGALREAVSLLWRLGLLLLLPELELELGPEREREREV